MLHVGAVVSATAAGRAALAGALHGVVEWLPVSSSGHVALLIDAAGWPEADPARRTERRALEVALHTGSLGPLGARVLTDVRASAAPETVVLAALAATGITAVIGGVAGPFVEQRFAGPRSVAAGLVAGSVALVVAERAAARSATHAGAAPAGLGGVERPFRSSGAAEVDGRDGLGRAERPFRSSGAAEVDGREPSAGRPLASVSVGDVLAVGVAQGMAIWPGVSRRAATLAAARARGLSPGAADALSWATGLPTLGAATVWQFWRARRSLALAPAAPLAGIAASAGVGWITRRLPDATAAWPAARWAAWRGALAAATLIRR